MDNLYAIASITGTSIANGKYEELAEMLRGYAIHQITSSSYEDALWRYMSYDFAEAQKSFNFGAYERIWVEYTSVLAGMADHDVLERLFYVFNMAHPDEFCGHSLSVSDIVELRYDDDIRYFYCDDFGYVPISIDDGGHIARIGCERIVPSPCPVRVSFVEQQENRYVQDKKTQNSPENFKPEAT